MRNVLRIYRLRCRSARDGSDQALPQIRPIQYFLYGRSFVLESTRYLFRNRSIIYGVWFDFGFLFWLFGGVFNCRDKACLVETRHALSLRYDIPCTI